MFSKVRMGLALVLGVVAFAGAVAAADNGDAPSTYGLASATSSAPELLGTGWTNDTTNPVTPAWTGDADDGIVGTVATWTPGLSTNSVTVKVVCGGYTEYLSMFIDKNDDGDFLDAGEKIDHPSFPTTLDGNYTFSNISLPFVNYTRNGLNKVAVRFILKFAGAVVGPTDSFSYGEVEDYLIDCYPAGLGITTPSPLPNAAVGSAYSTTITAMFGTTPYNWNTSITGLPPGITASIVSNNLVLSGNPTTAGTYTFNVSLTDSASPPASANRNYQLTVVPPPAAVPFLDTFTTDRGWVPGTTWSRGVCMTYSATSPTRSEPTTDATTTSTDNMILGDTRGGDFATNLGTTYWAVSPMVNCSTLSSVRLRFQRWLGCSIGSTASIEVTNNGTTWTPVWSSTGGTSQVTITDAAWAPFQYDITSVAAGMATVQVRFGIGPTGTAPHVGWSIDDFEIFEPGPDLEVREGGTGGTTITSNQAVGGLRDFGQVTMGVQSTPLTIALTNNGSTSCTFGSFVKGGANPADFYIQAGSLTNPLPSGGTTTFTVQFFVGTTGTPGVKTANITIPHNAGGVAGQNFIINLRGEAMSPGTGSLDAFETSATGAAIAHQQSATGTARDFGSVLVGSQSSPLTIVVSNPGPGTLTMTAPDMGGTWWNQFTVDTTGFLLSLPQGQTTSFTVTFAPTSQGSKDAFVRIPNSRQGGPTPFEIPVLGNGIAPVATFEARTGSVTGPTIAHNAPAAGTPRDFGDWSISAGPTTPPLTIVINNPGGQPLTLGTPTLGGANPGDFVLNTAGFTTNLQAGSNTSFTVAFDPTSVGQKNAEISITHNDTAQPTPFLILVTGNGVTTFAVIEVRETGATGTVLANPAPANGILNFGNRAVGAGPGNTATIYVANTGTAAMNLGTPALLPATTEFVLNTTGFAGSVPVGQSRTFTISFSPTSLGTKTAQVIFTHSGVGTATPFRLNVTGNGVPDAPYIEVREGSATGPMVPSGAVVTSGGGRDFGSIDTAAGPSAAQIIVFRNPGTQDLVLGTPALAGPNANQFTLNMTGFNATVAAGATTQFSVSFDPSAVGIKDAQVEFTQNDTTQASPYIVPIRGRGTSPTGVTVTTASLPNGDLGKAYPVTMLTAAQGVGPYTWSTYNSTLPRGLVLSSGGQLDGVPSDTVGIFQVTFRVTDSTGGTDDRQLSIAIGGTVLGKQVGGARNGGGCAAAGVGVAPVALAILAVVGWRRRRKQ